MDYTVIHPALGCARENRRYTTHLGPDCGRVTTALRCLVTQPLAHGSRRDRQLPVTSTASEKLGRPSGGSRLLHCNSATRSRCSKLCRSRKFILYKKSRFNADFFNSRFKSSLHYFGLLATVAIKCLQPYEALSVKDKNNFLILYP